MAEEESPMQPPPVSSGEGPKGGLIITIIVLAIIVIGGIVYLVYSTYKKPEKAVPTAPVTEEIPTVQPTTPATTPGVSTANWQTYTNSKPSYTIKYPVDWQIDSSKATAVTDDYELLELTLTKNNHKLEISMPGGYGPSVCAFKGAPLPTEGPGSGQTPAEYVEIANPNYPTRPFGRAIQPTLGGEKNSESIWYICQKEADSDYFVTATVVDLIRYLGPIEFDDTIVQEMDNIVRTIKAELK